MLAPWSNFQTDSIYLIPVLSFLLGLGGSLHCIGMCGGLVAACSKSKIDTFSYQIARLLGYSLLGLIVGFIGKVTLDSHLKNISLISAIFMGLLFCYFGFKILFKKSKLFFLFEWLGIKYQYAVQKLFKLNLPSTTQAFLVGLFSVLLPCGLLYGTVLSFGILYGPYLGFLSMFTFWCGTLPGLLFAPILISKYIKPLASKLPKLTSMALVILGIVTITVRVTPLLKSDAAPASKAVKCH